MDILQARRILFSIPAHTSWMTRRKSWRSPFHVAEAFTGLKGVLVSIEDTIKGFNMILNGEVDDLPEAAFNLVGTIDEAKEKAKKILAAAK